MHMKTFSLFLLLRNMLEKKEIFFYCVDANHPARLFSVLLGSWVLDGC